MIAGIFFWIVLIAFGGDPDLHSVNGKDVDPPGGHVFRCFTPPTLTDPKPDCINP